MKSLQAPLAFALSLCCAAPAASQMEKRWSGHFGLTEYEQQAPRVGAPAPPLRLLDLDGRPRSLALERGRAVVLLAGSFT